MRGMRERAKLIGGTFDVWSQLGSGTEAELTIPAASVSQNRAMRAGLPCPGFGGDKAMNTIPNPIGILAVDDHGIFRQGIMSLLTDQPDMKLVAQASSGLEAIQQYRVHRPDITLMDLQMPEMNGLDAIIAIRSEFPDAKIIVLTTYGGDVQVLRALKAGARGYLLKNTLHKNLLDTIRAVHSGKKSLSPEASYELAEHENTMP